MRKKIVIFLILGAAVLAFAAAGPIHVFFPDAGVTPKPWGKVQNPDGKVCSWPTMPEQKTIFPLAGGKIPTQAGYKDYQWPKPSVVNVPDGSSLIVLLLQESGKVWQSSIADLPATGALNLRDLPMASVIGYAIATPDETNAYIQAAEWIGLKYGWSMTMESLNQIPLETWCKTFDPGTEEAQTYLDVCSIPFTPIQTVLSGPFNPGVDYGGTILPKSTTGVAYAAWHDGRYIDSRPILDIQTADGDTILDIGGKLPEDTHGYYAFSDDSQNSLDNRLGQAMEFLEYSAFQQGIKDSTEDFTDILGTSSYSCDYFQ